MRYMFLLFSDENRFSGPDDPGIQKEGAGYGEFTGAVKASGAFHSGEALQSTATATVVRVDAAGAPLSTDGPFAETKEQLVGFYVLDCADLDEAIDLAAKIPAASAGGVEIRPIRELE